MITTSAPPRRSRIFEIALVLSVLTHLLLLLIYLGVFARIAPLIQPVPKDEQYAVSDVIRLEKRNVPRAETVAPPPQPRPVTQRAPAPATPVERPIAAAKPRVQREVARIVPRAPALPRTSARTAAVQTPQTVALNPAAPPGDAQPSAQDAAAAQQQRFRDAIAQANTSVRNFVPPNIPPAAIVPRPINQGRLSFEQLKRAYGTVDYVYQSGRRGDENWHIIRVWITYPDGKTELVNIPWPFYFPRNHDPIAVHDPRPFPAQPPPDGFVLPHPFDPSRFVCSFYPDECQALYNAEQHSGGPVAN